MELNKYGRLAMFALIISSILSAFVLGAMVLAFSGHENIEWLWLLIALLTPIGMLIYLSLLKFIEEVLST